jgi:hypothetical protein
MSSLWTPSGEHPVDDEGPGRGTGRAAPADAGGPGDDERAATEASAQVEELRRQLAATPAEVVVANHCYGLFELATVYLSQQPPLFEQARLAIDALGVLVDGLGVRLGETESALKDALAQIRLAFVQLAAASEADAGAEGAATNGADTPA